MFKLRIKDKTKIRICVLFFIMMLLFNPISLISVNADSNNIYYVSNSGDDSNSGLSPSQTWKTIGKVNSELNGGVINFGDDIYFKRGDIFSDDILRLRVGGNFSNKMIIGSYGTGERPIFDSNGNSNIQFSENNANNITIENLILKNSSSTSVVASVNLSNIIISNIFVKNSGHNGIYFDNTDRLKIKNCTIQNTDHCGLVLYGSKYNRLSNVTVENTFINGSGPEDALTIHKSDGTPKYNVGSNFLFKNVTTTGFGEQGFDLTSGENIILLNCESYGNDDSSILTGNEVKNVTITNFYSHDELGEVDTFGVIINPCEQLIIRNSIFYNAHYRQISIETGSKNVAFYNNNIVFGMDSSDGFIIDVKNSDGDTDNIFFKNNIFLSLRDTIPTNRFLRYLSPSSLSNTKSNWSHNIWWRGDGGDSDERWWTDNNIYLTYSDWLAKDQVCNDLRSDPLIENPSNNNWNLNESSPAIDAAAWLTKTNGSGSGIVIPVYNANYFTDGYGFTSGDCIFIGDDANLRIVNIDYDNCRLTVNRSISWNNNENVSLDSYFGSSLDIGAFEYEIEESNPPVISNIDAQPNPQSVGEAVNVSCSITSDFTISEVKINISDPNEGRVNVSMIDSGSFFYNSTFNLVGTYSCFIYAVDEEGNSVISDTFTFSIENSDISPVILEVNVISSDPLDTDASFGWINISCSVNDDNLHLVQLNYTDFNGASVNVSMDEGAEDTFYYNTSFDEAGDYSYFIWCNNTQSNCNTSSVYDYSMPVNWDINEDGSLTLLDFTLISNLFGETGSSGWIREDVNNNGRIEIFDLMILSNHFED